MCWDLYDYVANGGRNLFKEWSEGLQTADLARLNRKLEMLERNGPELGPGLLAGPIKRHAHIYKIKINGNVALRPLLCKGPIKNDKEFTLLMGAFERDRDWVPKNAPNLAEARREEVLADHKRRRCPHEPVRKIPQTRLH
jgi:hypothetical protein